MYDEFDHSVTSRALNPAPLPVPIVYLYASDARDTESVAVTFSVMLLMALSGGATLITGGVLSTVTMMLQVFVPVVLALLINPV